MQAVNRYFYYTVDNDENITPEIAFFNENEIAVRIIRK
jgi:hypothetical protein